MSGSDIIRVTPYINQVNDTLIGGGGGNIGPQIGLAPGQLGKTFSLDANDLVYNSVIGTVLPGRFRYVRLAPSSLVPVVGQLLFRDNTVPWTTNFRVTTDETLSSAQDSIFVAGVCLNPSIVAGNYTVIQILGDVYLKCRAVLSNAGAIGAPLYASQAGGADQGFVDQLGGGGAATLSNVVTYQGTLVAKAVGLPVGGALVLATLMDFGQED